MKVNDFNDSQGKCLIVLNRAINFKKSINLKTFTYFVGVDSGCMFLLENKLPLHLAIGDFDSVSSLEKVAIFKKAKVIKEFPSKKDYFDGELALKALKDKKFTQILMIANSNFIDLDVMTFYLIAKYQVTFQNQSSYCLPLKTGINKLTPQAKYQYISFIAINSAEISLNNFKYNKKKLLLQPFSPAACHNEFINHQSGIIDVKKGVIIAIFS